MKRIKKMLASLFIMSSIITVMPQGAYAETVNKQLEKTKTQVNSDEKGTWVRKWNGVHSEDWYKIRDSWATGWKKIDGYWYYFYSDGTPAMSTLDTSWVQIDGKWYSFTSNRLMTNSVVYDLGKYDYYVGDNGEIAEMPTNGWVKYQTFSHDEWRYRVNNSWAKGWQLIDGKWYYFYPSGTMMTNFTKDGYRAGNDGVCVPS